MLSVKTEQVQALADTITQKNQSIGSAFDDVASAMASLKGAWSGEAGEQVISLYNSLREGCIDVQQQAIGNYAEFLRQRVAAGYEAVETGNIRLSDAFK